MSALRRLKNIEKARFVKQPMLCLVFDAPTEEDLRQIEDAKRTDRWCVCINSRTAEAYLLGQSEPGWWEI